jgi:hypothetical protein
MRAATVTVTSTDPAASSQLNRPRRRALTGAMAGPVSHVPRHDGHASRSRSTSPPASSAAAAQRASTAIPPQGLIGR